MTLADKSAQATLKPNAPFEPDRFRAAIKSASQEVRTFDVRLRATVERQNSRYYLRSPGVAQKFVVRGGPSSAKLAGLAGRQVRALGTLVSTAAGLELELTEVRPP